MKRLIIHLIALAAAMSLPFNVSAQILSPEGMKNAKEVWKQYLKIADGKTKVVHYEPDNYERKVLNCVACVYATGALGNKDEEKALEYFSRLAERGDTGFPNFAPIIVAQFYLNGIGCTASEERFVQYLRHSKHTRTTYKPLFLRYYYGLGGKEDYTQAIESLPLNASPLELEIEYLLGKCYKYGRGVDQNDSLALNHFMAAGEYPPALSEMGQYYWTGQGVQRDIGKAFDCFSRSTSALPSLYYLARVYHLGLEDKHNIGKACEYYQSVIQRSEQSDRISDISPGYSINFSSVVRLFFEPLENLSDFEKSHPASLSYSPVLAESNSYILDPEDIRFADSARVYLAECYLQSGKEDKAETMLREASVSENSFAQYALAELLASRNDEIGAFFWYKRASESARPNYDAMLRLSRCYRLGSGTERNTELADKWSSRFFSYADKTVDELIEDELINEDELQGLRAQRGAIWYTTLLDEKKDSLQYQLLKLDEPIATNWKNEDFNIWDNKYYCYGESGELVVIYQDILWDGLEWKPKNIHYIGELKDNKYHGYGIRVFDERFYIGQWEAGEMNGNGEMFWTNGEFYVGEWKCGKKDGTGIYGTRSGKTYDVIYKDDSLIKMTERSL